MRPTMRSGSFLLETKSLERRLSNVNATSRDVSGRPS